MESLYQAKLVESRLVVLPDLPAVEAAKRLLSAQAGFAKEEDCSKAEERIAALKRVYATTEDNSLTESLKVRWQQEILDQIQAAEAERNKRQRHRYSPEASLEAAREVIPRYSKDCPRSVEMAGRLEL